MTVYNYYSLLDLTYILFPGLIELSLGRLRGTINFVVAMEISADVSLVSPMFIEQSFTVFVAVQSSK